MSNIIQYYIQYCQVLNINVFQTHSPQFINQARFVKYDQQVYFDKTFTDLWFINHAIVEIVVSRSFVH